MAASRSAADADDAAPPLQSPLQSLPPALLEVIAARVEPDFRHGLRAACRATRAAANAAARGLALAAHPALLRRARGEPLPAAVAAALRAAYPNVETLMLGDRCVAEVLANAEELLSPRLAGQTSGGGGGIGGGGIGGGVPVPVLPAKRAASAAARSIDAPWESPQRVSSSSEVSVYSVARSASAGSLASLWDDASSDGGGGGTPRAAGATDGDIGSGSSGGSGSGDWQGHSGGALVAARAIRGSHWSVQSLAGSDASCTSCGMQRGGCGCACEGGDRGGSGVADGAPLQPLLADSHLAGSAPLLLPPPPPSAWRGLRRVVMRFESLTDATARLLATAAPRLAELGLTVGPKPSAAGAGGGDGQRARGQARRIAALRHLAPALARLECDAPLCADALRALRTATGGGLRALRLDARPRQRCDARCLEELCRLGGALEELTVAYTAGRTLTHAAPLTALTGLKKLSIWVGSYQTASPFASRPLPDLLPAAAALGGLTELSLLAGLRRPSEAQQLALFTWLPNLARLGLHDTVLRADDLLVLARCRRLEELSVRRAV